MQHEISENMEPVKPEPKSRKKEPPNPHVLRLEALMADHRAKGRDEHADRLQEQIDAIESGELKP